MPWREASIVSQRYEFVMLAQAEGANMAALCRAFGISRAKGYKWLARFQSEGRDGLIDRSRRPKRSPAHTPARVETAALAVRAAHPAWGGRKIRRRLEVQGLTPLPAPSTITGILRRYGKLAPEEGRRQNAFIRFEHPHPNALIQIDFKGHFALAEGRCHPLTVIDDHSRFALAVEACADERGDTVKDRLTAAFRRYGLPERMTMDNGSPWGSDERHGLTPLTVWLMRLGIRVGHSRPYHPQTQGKNERFNGTLYRELIRGRQFATLEACQRAFAAWRDVYNLERPHEALGLAVPASRYRPSRRPFPEVLPAILYPEGAIVRRVQDRGWINFKGRLFKLPKALKGHAVAIEPRIGEDGAFDVIFCTTRIVVIDLKTPVR